ncbi:hypothetical protein AGABI1DRAFT_74993 [Agaricus bisporus var. burnettii JB137-S8]|uniref:Uncharacterized protein n=2 Tax=Agaricus bisporus var. burnettii TaxID=192524 RepID=K5VW04_AGABU|nr:hypothetical protein AGABI2DRAFT_218287 [Agaricus bisporus var. bisporus H97]XP_007330397.1 uncharacterized protein AGABI1DRAFT_74993 [Agaricus bisporus var. burnettii JB137-S8]EKM78634.1 hypothetical protein AGABI1DRAFT_74993 [Agaricus bisporus var. burnettii JB137-S8]EKV49188.1 hypothetical protein AGABI2DRAFT_218287 [Agaricus bisporus var. bisporus H97]KAF7773373.1 hypothetical protein Agabi119p4_5540 [Agaricus bisporus var. burnettii]
MSANSSPQKPVDNIRHSDPIPIGQNRGRARSVSSASSSSTSSVNGSPTTPISTSFGSGNIRTSPTSSPIYSYFMSSPTKTNSTFPLRRKFPGTSPVYEAEEEDEKVVPVATQMRRTSTHIANRFTEPKTTPLPEPQVERGTGFLRRLSLSTAPLRKGYIPTNSSSPPPNTAADSSPDNLPFNNKPRRSATFSTDGRRPRRAPSPMGERILKGHFDGF